MFRWSRSLAAALMFGAAVSAQGIDPDVVIERYLEERSLDSLLIEHLHGRLERASASQRLDIAERLGRLYVVMLASETDPEERRDWEARSRHLLKTVPEADSFDLRISLAKARYQPAEDAAERFRLRLATPAEKEEAERVLREVANEFRGIGTNADREVRRYERRERSASDSDPERTRVVLAQSRRSRSLAMYYAGWSNYYLALLTGNTQYAGEALRNFGWLLNATDGRGANLERLPRPMLRYEHVARAALGCAMCASIRGEHIEAERWIEAIESAEGLAPDVAEQMFPRRLVILTAGRRWADLQYAVTQRRRPGAARTTTPLEIGHARLLAILMLEVLDEVTDRSLHKQVTRELAEVALADLVAQDAVDQVLDLVSQFGTAPIGDEGFVVHYVRGLRAFDRARELHAATGAPEDEPIDDDETAVAYRDAITQFEDALAWGDSTEFPREVTRALSVIGLSRFYVGDFKEAADMLERAFRTSATSEQGEEALWLAVVALDRAVEGPHPSMRDRRDELAALYMHNFPRTERAARLLLRRATSGLVADREAVDVLLALPEESPLYEAARRTAARLLYRLYRRSGRDEKEFTALRFAEVADELIDLDHRLAADGTGEDALEAAQLVLLRARQLCDVLLDGPGPDAARAERALDILDAVAVHTGLVLEEFEDELLYRRLQIAIIRSDEDEIEVQVAYLRGIGGRFAEAADRSLYRRALERWKFESENADLAREVVEHGARVLSQTGTSAEALQGPGVLGLHNNVAEAAAACWRIEGDIAMRDLALEVDASLIEYSRPTAPVLMRFAELSETTGDRAGALEAWRTLLAGFKEGSESWYEARYQSLRLLWETDPGTARRVMKQFRVLHPNFGPEPWRDRLRALNELIVATPAGPDEAPVETPEGDERGSS